MMPHLRIILITLLTLPIIAAAVYGIREYDNRGEHLAKKYCSSCHLFPEPSLLPKKTWTEHVLPEMGLRLGMGDRNLLLKRMTFKQFDQLVSLGVYPDTPAMDLDDWKQIIRYYRRYAPEEPIEQQVKAVQENIPSPFQVQEIIDSVGQGNVTMLHAVPGSGELWVGKRNNQVHIYDSNLQFSSIARMPSVPVAMLDSPIRVLLCIGNMLPTEDRNGRLISSTPAGLEILADSLHRPVHMQVKDLNADNVPDYIIAEFGYETGSVSWINGATREKKTVHSQPGARNFVVRDFNGDGRPDLMVLFAQAREEIVLFLNKGEGQFERKLLLQFQSVYGSSYFDLADMDGDGLEDIIMTNGDNADYSIVKKKYHGLRIFKNISYLQYKEQYYYPVFGATKVIAMDFDGDGDNDLAVSAFFAATASRETFLYFRNNGNGNFSVSDLGLPTGYWLRMQTTDLNQDGLPDLVLGNFELADSSKKSGIKKGLQVLVLKTTTKANY